MSRPWGPMRQFLFMLASLLAFASAGFAQCQGENLIAKMSPEAQAALRAEAAKSPFAVGNYWQATRGDAVIHLIGTYHFDDPRHAATMARIAPVLASAQLLLVEAGPKEEESLKARIADDPALIVNTDGPTLPEIMAEADWKRLADATAARGIPGFMAAKFRPWYVSMLLAMPACNIAASATPNGLDAQLIAAAKAEGVPVQALEPYDTVFDIFEAMTQDQQLDMITSALALEDKSADLAITLADSYFAQESRLIWEFNRLQALSMPGYTPERVQQEFATMEQSMMIARNRAWIPVIETAAAQGPVLVAFGALHLSGPEGVLALLEAKGFTLERLVFR